MAACAQTFPQLLLQLHHAGRDGGELRRAIDAYRHAMQLYSGFFTGSGKTTLTHEVGTASLAQRHGASFDLVVAALLHAAYLTGDWGHYRVRVTAAKRRTLRSVIGPQAELYVYEFCRAPWDSETIAGFARRAGTLTPLERAFVLLRLLDELERLLDYGGIIAFRTAEPVKAWLRMCRNDLCALAEELGGPGLAAELGEAIDATLTAELPPEIMGLSFPGPLLSRTVPGSYRKRVGVAVYQTLAGQARRLERALRQRLRPGAAPAVRPSGLRRP